MKTRVILLIAVSTILTLSFTYASVKGSHKKHPAPSTKIADAPVEGLGSEDKF